MNYSMLRPRHFPTHSGGQEHPPRRTQARPLANRIRNHMLGLKRVKQTQHHHHHRHLADTAGDEMKITPLPWCLVRFEKRPEQAGGEGLDCKSQIDCTVSAVHNPRQRRSYRRCSTQRINSLHVRRGFRVPLRNNKSLRPSSRYLPA